jgi:hypothetical protein
MDQSWPGRAMVPGGMYRGIHDYGYSEQPYEQDFNDAGEWNENPYPPFDAPGSFSGFQDQEHPQEIGQYDGQYEGQYDDQYGNQDDGQDDDDQDDDEAVAKEDDQDEDQPSQAELHKAEVDKMITEGVYQCLIPTEIDYLKQPRIQVELKELKRSGVPGAKLDDVSAQYWVGRLFLAFKNIEGIKDKPCKNGKPAQSAQRLSGNYYPDKAVEIACWKIVVSFLPCNVLGPFHMDHR